MSDSIKNFVSDYFYKTHSYSDDTTVEFIIALASEAKSLNETMKILEENEIKMNNNEAKEFAKELFNLLPKKRSKEQSYIQKKQKQNYVEALNWKKSNQFSKLISNDEILSSAKITKEKKLKPKPKKRHKFIKSIEQQSNDNNNDSNDDNDLNIENPKKKRKLNVNNDKELKRKQDQIEKKLLEAHLRKKDLEKKKKLTKEEIELIKDQEIRNAIKSGIQNDPNIRNNVLDNARIESRNFYVQKRAPQMLAIKEQQIRMEEEEFDSEELDKDEIIKLKQTKIGIKMAKEIRKNRDYDKNYYYIPDGDKHFGDINDNNNNNENGNKLSVKYRFNDENDNKNYVNEQELWENDRINNALYSNKETYDNKWKNKSKKEGWEIIETDIINEIENEIKDGKSPDKMLLEKLNENDINNIKNENKLNLHEFRKTLPIYKHKNDLIEAIKTYQIIIIVAETGSGKTTQIPQYIYENKKYFLGDNQKIAITQPRRVAAMSVAARVAKEMNDRLGGLVGYCVRFEDKTSQNTRIKYMTDGMLLREFLISPELEQYNILMIDEAHERSLHTDILFGLVKDICRARKEVKLIISSATLDADKFSEFFDNAPQYKVPGRKHKVDTYYLKQPDNDYIRTASIAIIQFHKSQPLPGDILVFLTGQEEIEIVQQNLEQITKEEGSKMKELIILPIYANLPAEQQSKIFLPTPKNARKVILATNIAETSLTINGIIYVIDCGMNKLSQYNPKNNLDSLTIQPISKACADQRKGRAGRISDGKCFRLFTKKGYDNLVEMTIPEIQRTNLSSVVLMLKTFGINNLITFDFMDPPPAEALIKSLELLYGLNALNHKGELTKCGRQMAEFPLNPQLSKSLIESSKFDCVSDILSIVSLLSCNMSIFYKPKDESVTATTQHRNFFNVKGDHYTLLNIYKRWSSNEVNYNRNWCHQNFLQYRSLNRARDIRDQLKLLLERVEIEINQDKEVIDNDINSINDIDITNIGKSLASAFFFNIASLSINGNYKTFKHNEEVFIHPSSSLYHEFTTEEKIQRKNMNVPKWVLFNELLYTTNRYMRNVIEIQKKWLFIVAPHVFKKKESNI